MRSTTIRFADEVYHQLEQASAATGLPINSIVVVACLDWLEKDRSSRLHRQMPRLAPALRGRAALQQTVGLQARGARQGLPSALVGNDPLYIFSAAAQDALAQAHEQAERTRQWIGTEHLLHGLGAADEGRAAHVLQRLGVDVDAVLVQLREEEGDEPPGEKGRRLLPTSQLRQVLKRARDEMTREGAGQLGTDHLLLGLLLEGGSRASGALEALGLTYRAARDALVETGPEV
jgi:Clp amino terminal domain, pathogenicity island component